MNILYSNDSCAVRDHALLFDAAWFLHTVTGDKGFDLDYSRYSLLLFTTLMVCATGKSNLCFWNFLSF